MTPQKQNEAIHKLLGHELVKTCPCGERVDSDGCHVPDYTYDLKAMCEVEQLLITTNDRVWEYRDRLHGNVSALPFQRAEALLRTLNKWEEE